MAVYSFEAMAADGKISKGVLDADSARGARSLLRSQELVPLKVVAVGSAFEGAQNGAGESGDAGSTSRRSLWRTRAFSSSELAVWTRQLAGLVKAGMPLERALTALLEDTEKPAQRDVVATLRAEVHAGAPFGQALGQHPKQFSPIYLAVVSAGEQSGDLGLVLTRLADDLQEQQALQSKLLGAALYPAIVTLVAMVIVLFLMTYVVPQVAQVFVGSKRALPPLTSLMLGISGALRSHGWILLLAVFTSAVWLKVALANTSFRQKFDAAWLELPVLGKLARSYNTARFASTLAMLCAAGVPILKALQAAAETLANQAMRADALDALVLVREGTPLAQALRSKKRFPGLLSMFAKLGEQTGQLPSMLSHAAQQLQGEVQRRALQLATLLEPLLIVAMGVVVMLIVLAVLLPIIQLNQLVR